MWPARSLIARPIVAVSRDRDKGVVTLTGNVISQDVRQQAQTLAASISNVQQVVNELQVKNQKATGTK